MDVAGVGYEVFVPLGALGRLPAPPESATLFVHTHVREDALVLYGFAQLEDRTAFRTLLGISNVGPKLALAILSSMDARQLASAIASQDAGRFKGIPGVGKRTVERLLLELKDKLGFVSTMAAVPAPTKRNGTAPPVPSSALTTVTALLVNMGFKVAEAERAVAAIADSIDEDAPVETLLRRALEQLS